MTDFQLNDAGLLVPAKQKLYLGGHYDAQIIRAGEVIDEFGFDNLIVNEGLNSLLNVYLDAATQITSWYCGLFQGNYTPVATVTGATIGAASTECSSYTAGVRQPFTPASSTAQSSTNSASRATFTFNAGVTIYGAFLVSTAAINGVTGTLFSAAAFGAAKAVASGDQLLLTYSLSAASA
jgi:hypothetical protein